MDDNNYKVALALLLKAIQSGQANHEIILEVGATPPLLINDGGLPRLPLVIKGKVIDKAFFDHGIRRGILERLDEIVEAPIAIYGECGHVI